MPALVTVTDSPDEVLAEAGEFLSGDPVRHNLILTLLRLRVSHPEPGRYWIVREAGEPRGVAFQSPPDYRATVTPMPAASVVALVDAMVDGEIVLPGVTGEAATVARFAGHWAERTRGPVRPIDGQRLYEVHEVTEPTGVAGRSRLATAADHEVLAAWFSAFGEEVGEPITDAREVVSRRVAAAHFWLWEDGGAAVAMAAVSEEQCGTVRIGPVFTPPDRRAHGYASALVASMSLAARAAGLRCILYTDLTNPTSNAIYQRMGYRVVSELLRYEFGTRFVRHAVRTLDP